MPRKNINMSLEAHEQLRAHKVNFQHSMKTGQMSDIKYLLRIAAIVEKTIKMKQG